MKKGIIPAGILTAIAGILAAIAILIPKIEVAPQNQALGSVTGGNEYYSTTTSANISPYDIQNKVKLLRNGPGTVGSVILTGIGIAEFELYDATTSNQLLRASTMSSSTILVASFPRAAPAGTYTFDIALRNGLLLATTTKAEVMGTTTITWR